MTDLRSTNGSIVQLPGNAARKLRQGESVVVSAGTLVDIGDETLFGFCLGGVWSKRAGR